MLSSGAGSLMGLFTKKQIGEARLCSQNQVLIVQAQARMGQQARAAA